MGDRAGLLRLLRDLRAEQQPGKAADLEAAIVGLFDEIREELNNDVDQANTLALETVRSTKEAAELRINQLRERHDMETKPLYAEIERLRAELERALETIKGQNESYSIQFKEFLDACAAIAGILAEPYGCPMCDSGKLRNPEKSHWPDCPYAIANDVLGLKAG